VKQKLSPEVQEKAAVIRGKESCEMVMGLGQREEVLGGWGGLCWVRKPYKLGGEGRAAVASAREWRSGRVDAKRMLVYPRNRCELCGRVKLRQEESQRALTR